MTTPSSMPDALVTRRASSSRKQRTHLPLATAAIVLAVALVGGLWAALRALDRSFVLTGNEERLASVVLVVLAIAGLSVLLFAVRGLLCAMRSRRLFNAERAHDARVAAEDASQWVWYVAGSAMFFGAIAFLAVLLSANDGAVRRVFFNWTIFGKSFRPLSRAFLTNIKVFLVAEVLVLVWAMLVAVARLMPSRGGAPVRLLATIYTDLFRGMPAVLVLYLIYFGSALAKLPVLGELSSERQRFWLPVIALTLVYGAYVAEVYRAGLDSIHWSQTAASRSLGLSHAQTLRYVVIPQAVRRVIPPLLNDFVGLQKDTALMAFLGVVEVFNQASLLKSRYFNFTPVIGAGIAFVIVTIPFARLTDYLIKRDAAKMRAGS